jgi:cellobiose phosphorylase
MEFNLERAGKHGLPCGLEADWNDCLSWAITARVSSWHSQLYYALTMYSEICTLLGKSDESAWALKKT